MRKWLFARAICVCGGVRTRRPSPLLKIKSKIDEEASVGSSRCSCCLGLQSINLAQFGIYFVGGTGYSFEGARRRYMSSMADDNASRMTEEGCAPPLREVQIEKRKPTGEGA